MVTRFNSNTILRNAILANVGTIYYFPILGQSQAGGYNNSPSITNTSASYVYTLTNGPINSSPSGNFVGSIEGDTFTDTGGSPTSSNVETIATSFAQQLKTFRNKTNTDYYVVTVHASGGAALQDLAKGGFTKKYEQLTASVARVKTLADSIGYRLIVNPILFHGGNGDNIGTTYKAKILDLYDDFNTDLRAITSQSEMFLFTHQQRIIGSPDYGIQQYEASITQSNIVVVGPEYPLLLSLGGSVDYQGDQVHITNHGTRYLAMIWAQAAYYKLFQGGYEALELDISNAAVSGTNRIVIPVLNTLGSLVVTSSGGFELYNATTSTKMPITASVSSSTYIVLTMSSSLSGVNNLRFTTGLTASGSLKSISSNIPSFNNSAGNPYLLDKYMVRAGYSSSLNF